MVPRLEWRDGKDWHNCGKHKMTIAHQRGSQLSSRSNVPLGRANPFVGGFNSRWFRATRCSCRGECRQIIVVTHLRVPRRKVNRKWLLHFGEREREREREQLALLQRLLAEYRPRIPQMRITSREPN